MLGKDKCEKILKTVIELTGKADEAEVSIFSGEAGLTRFASNYIHQNVRERNGQVRLRVIIGKRIGHSSTNKTDPESLKNLVDRAFQIAKLSEEDPNFPGLPQAAPVQQFNAFRPSTERYSPQKRAEAVASLIRLAKEKGLTASGAFKTGLREFAIANSKGVFLYHPVTVADFSTVIMSEDSSGYAGASSIDVHDLDLAALAKEAVDKAQKSRHPVELAPGDYPVVLEEYAVGTLVGFLGFLGFGSRAFHEGRSFLSEKINQQVAHPMVSIWDDGLDPRGLPQPFDFEGSPKTRVELIKDGIAKSAVWDSYSAGLARVPNTGHGLPSPNGMGAIPLNTFMAPGNIPKVQLAKGIKKGVWVTRFHYTNPVHPKKTLITGMTRDGTFIIEDGEITRGIKNLRFTNSILGALEKVEALSTETKTFIGSFESTCVPSARISSMTFSGVTEF